MQQTPERPTALRPNLTVETQPTKYDRTSAALVTGILISAFLFAVMFCIWLTGNFDFSRVAVGPFPVPPDTGILPPKGSTEDILEPGVQEFPEVATPQLAKTLLAVTDAISSVPASLNKRTGDARQMGKGFGWGHNKGGPDLGPTPGIPDHKRWSILFEAESIDDYTEQLAFFNIDVAAIHPTENKIWRVHHEVDGGVTVSDSDRESENKTLRFGHSKKRMQGWDKEICRRAGVESRGLLTAQFYPQTTRTTMNLAEAKAVANAGKKLKDVRKTVFKVVPDGDVFAFKVVEISYH